MTRRKRLPKCPPKFPLRDRPLLSPTQAGSLTGLFKNLANETRLRLLHALVRTDEMCVSDIAATLEMRPQAVSNQLQRLVDRRILAAKRIGNQVHYHIADPCVISLLNQGLCLMEDADGRKP